MRRLAALLALTTLAGGNESPEDQLTWVETADASAMLESDLTAGRLRFFAICDYSCDVRGISRQEYGRCYSKAAALENIAGTTDVIRSDRQKELQIKASMFASEYNRLLAARLDQAGKNACAKGERWDEFFSALSAYVRKMTPTPPFAWVAAYPEPHAGGRDFRIHIPPTIAPPEALETSVCKMAHEYGIPRAVRFEVTRGDIRTPAAPADFSCIDPDGPKQR